MLLLILFGLVAIGVSFLMGISFVHHSLFPRKKDLDLLLQTPIVLFSVLSIIATSVKRFTPLHLLGETIAISSWMILILEIYFYPKYLYTLFGWEFSKRNLYKLSTILFEVLFLFLYLQKAETLFFIICSIYSSFFLLFFTLTFSKSITTLHSKIKQQFIARFLNLNLFLAVVLIATSITFIINHRVSQTLVLTVPLLLYSIAIIIITSQAYLAEITQAKDQKASKNQVQDFCMRYSLTTREKEVLELVTQKKKYKEIAESLCISLHTVKAHMKSLYAKTGINDKNGLIELLQYHN